MATVKAEPTSPANLKKINAFCEKNAQALANLFDRWQDEKEYEDINDYAKAMQKLMPASFKLIKFSKRPFGFTFCIGTPAVYSMFCTSRNCGWKRIS